MAAGSFQRGSRNPVRWQQRRALAVTGVILLSTGVAWLVLHNMASVSDGLPHPAEALLIKAHALAAWIAAFVYGSFLSHHAAAGWRLKHRRQSALMLVALLSLGLLSAYALGYVVPENLRPAMGWFHAAVGTLAWMVLRVHRRRSTV